MRDLLMPDIDQKSDEVRFMRAYITLPPEE